MNTEPFRPVIDITNHPDVTGVAFEDEPRATIIVTLQNGEVRREIGPSRSSAALMFIGRNRDLFPRAESLVPITDEEWTKDPLNTPEFFAEVRRVLDGEPADKSSPR